MVNLKSVITLWSLDFRISFFLVFDYIFFFKCQCNINILAFIIRSKGFILEGYLQHRGFLNKSRKSLCYLPPIRSGICFWEGYVSCESSVLVGAWGETCMYAVVWRGVNEGST